MPRTHATLTLAMTAVLIPLIPGCTPATTSSCATRDGNATINVAGTYDYFGTDPFSITGTITFEQDGTTVRVIDTTYDFTNNRRLMGEGTLVGNNLEIALVPLNGQTDYRADVTFRFSNDGDTFCVEYSDTNDDAGTLGEFRGTRRQ